MFAIENPLYTHYVVAERSLKRLDLWVPFAVPHVNAELAREWMEEVKGIYKEDMRGFEILTRDEYMNKLETEKREVA